MALIECFHVLVHQSFDKIVHNTVTLSYLIIRRQVGEEMSDPRNDGQQFAIVIGTFLEEECSATGPTKEIDFILN